MTINTASVISENIIAKRIRFVRSIASTTLPIVQEFSEPQKYFAVSENVPFENLFSATREYQPVDEVTIAFYVTSCPFPVESENQIELEVKGIRAIWRPGKIFVQCDTSRREEIFSALVQFAFYENELRKLELEVKTNLELAKDDVRLTHAVSKSDLHEQKHVNNMTRRVTFFRMNFVKLEPALECIASSLDGPVEHLIEKLSDELRVEERLEACDDQMEVLEDLYELCNDRLTEFSYYHKESNLERWVIFLLWLEVALLLLELVMLWPHH